MTSTPVTFGIKTSQADTTYADVLRIWRDADEIESFDDAWLVPWATGRPAGSPTKLSIRCGSTAVDRHRYRRCLANRRVIDSRLRVEGGSASGHRSGSCAWPNR
jgi:hypothetical protein